MKTKLNLICFLLFCALGLSLFLNILSGVEGTNEAWQIIRKDDPNKSSDEKSSVVVDLCTVVRLVPSIPGSYRILFIMRKIVGRFRFNITKSSPASTRHFQKAN